jgi:hypothetical protein
MCSQDEYSPEEPEEFFRVVETFHNMLEKAHEVNQKEKVAKRAPVSIRSHGKYTLINKLKD